MAGPNYTAAYLSHVENGKRRPSHEALTHFAERLGITFEQLVTGRDPKTDLQIEIEAQSALAQIHAGDFTNALRALERVRAEAKATGHSHALQQAEVGVGHALRAEGRIEEALAAYERAEALASGEPAEHHTSSLTGQARCLFQLGEVRDAIHLLESHLIELQRKDVPDPSRLVEVYAALIPPYFESGMIERAKETASKGWALAPKIDDAEQRACLYVNRAQLMLTQGERREALASLALAEDLYRHLGWYREGVKVTIARALVMIDEDDLVEAEKLLTEILSGPSPPLSRFDHVKVLTQLALVRRLQGAPTDALEIAQRAVKVAGQQVPVPGAEATREAGLSAVALGDLASALSYWRRALKTFSKFGDHEEAAKTARLIGDHLVESGAEKAAAKAYREGLEAVTKLR